MHHCNTPVILFLYNFPCSTTKALDHRIILRALIVSSGSVLFIKYAKYGYIQISSIIMISSGSDVLSVPDLLAPEPFVASWFNSPKLEVLLPFIDLSMISSQNTSGGMGKHWDPMFARLLASSLLALLICDTSHPSKVPSR
jgi:hypothetical protein